MRISSTYLACSFVVICINASEAKQINLANKTEPDGEYEISFCARPSLDASKGLPGHAFVSFSHSNSTGRDFLSIGHTVASGASPVAAAWTLFSGSIEGRLKQEVYTAAVHQCLQVLVNKDDYQKALSLTQSPLTKIGITRGNDIVMQAYKLGAEDCVSWMVSVAEKLKTKGLKIPNRNVTDTPMKYMEKLIAAN
jgi:hypothetical protein